MKRDASAVCGCALRANVLILLLILLRISRIATHITIHLDEARRLGRVWLRAASKGIAERIRCQPRLCYDTHTSASICYFLHLLAAAAVASGGGGGGGEGGGRGWVKEFVTMCCATLGAYVCQ
jgi:hypothetical protein